MRATLTVIELVFLAMLAAGVWLAFGTGWALIAGGVSGVVACEWASVRQQRGSE